jgi:thiosulfate/3-mercaptopyruvate sulfurtransferase
MTWTTVIDTETVAAHLADSSFVVVDCRYSVEDPPWGEREYTRQHIPGAAFTSIDDDLSAPKTGTNGRHPLPDPASASDALGRLGIASGVQVVAYDQDAGMYASRLWWLARWLGHDAIAVLDGGFAKWIAEERPVRPGIETHTRRPFTGTPHTDWVANTDDVQRLVDTRGDDGHRRWLLLDARAPERFRGEIEPIDRLPGHIPGAANHFYKWNVREDGTFRSASELRDRLRQSIGPIAPAHVICYCGSGVTACQDLLAFERAGLPGGKLYPGSWSEWVSDPARPIERG